MVITFSDNYNFSWHSLSGHQRTLVGTGGNSLQIRLRQQSQIP
uniref:Uncharacterized protein n=1 Tax=Klebsiella pneumoniae TaxID=573 RepID=A0A286NCC3_KLEPN|nr:hypothetical protein [Klebsiella pneumoniae]QIK04566.1 hypothetical protein [Klebsiella pneumoniae]QJS01133.1 hypothetical protein [Klebsiella pneumoniae]